MRNLLLCAAAIAAFTAPLAPAIAQTVPLAAVEGTRLDVVATGEVMRAPDLVRIQAGVVTQAPTASEAIRQNSRQMEAMRAALRRAGVADRDVQTSAINLHPEMRHSERAAPQFAGYRAMNQVSVRFRDIAEAGPILDALVEAGANNIEGPMFLIEDPQEALDQARVAALANARERADLYARSLGMRVVRVLAVSEAGAGHMPPRPMVRTFAVSEDAQTQIEPGEQAVTANLTVTFELR